MTIKNSALNNTPWVAFALGWVVACSGNPSSEIRERSDEVIDGEYSAASRAWSRPAHRWVAGGRTWTEPEGQSCYDNADCGVSTGNCMLHSSLGWTCDNTPYGSNQLSCDPADDTPQGNPACNLEFFTCLPNVDQTASSILGPQAGTCRRNTVVHGATRTVIGMSSDKKTWACALSAAHTTARASVHDQLGLPTTYPNHDFTAADSTERYLHPRYATNANSYDIAVRKYRVDFAAPVDVNELPVPFTGTVASGDTLWVLGYGADGSYTCEGAANGTNASWCFCRDRDAAGNCTAGFVGCDSYDDPLDPKGYIGCGVGGFPGHAGHRRGFTEVDVSSTSGSYLVWTVPDCVNSKVRFCEDTNGDGDTNDTMISNGDSGSPSFIPESSPMEIVSVTRYTSGGPSVLLSTSYGPDNRAFIHAALDELGCSEHEWAYCGRSGDTCYSDANCNCGRGENMLFCDGGDLTTPGVCRKHRDD